MADFDYGNARLRAMRSRLLSRRELDELAECEDLQGLITTLAKTPYRRSIETALARTEGMQCITEALRSDLVNTIGKVNEFYRDQAGEMVAIVLRTYDIHNLKAIFRGLSRNVPSGEILATLLPVGKLNYLTLVELARATGLRGAIDQIASMGLPFARPLLQLRARGSGASERGDRLGADTFEIELALDRWHFQEAQDYLKNEAEDGSWLLKALHLEVDLANILTALRFAQAPQERSQIAEQIGSSDIVRLFLGPGNLPFSLLAEVGMADTLEVAVEMLAGTIYDSYLKIGFEKYHQSGRLSDFEKQLRRFRLHWTAGMIAKDPLGIGVVLGYLALKETEVSNIRWIAQGINLGLSPTAIRAEMELVV